MYHKTIQIKNFTLYLKHKVCFEDFNTSIKVGDKIALIGRNGSGKSSLLKMIYEEVKNINDLEVGFVAQTLKSNVFFSHHC